MALRKEARGCFPNPEIIEGRRILIGCIRPGRRSEAKGRRRDCGTGLGMGIGMGLGVWGIGIGLGFGFG